MSDLLTSPWFWFGAYYAVAGIAGAVLVAREVGRMTVGDVVGCFLLGFFLTPLCLFIALMTKEIWRRK